MPTMPPVRKARRKPWRSPVPVSRAAAATRTFAWVASVMPMKPTAAENEAPIRKNTARPIRTAAPPSFTGRISITMKTSTAKTASVRNCRLR